MKVISTERISVSLLSGLLIFLLAGCAGGGGATDDSGGGGTGLPGAPAVSIAAGNGENILTMAPGTGTSASTFTLYWSTSPTVTVTTGTKIPSVQPTFHHTGLTNGTPVFYVVTSDLSTGASFPSDVVGSMPGTWFKVETCSTPPCSPSSLPPARDSHTAVYDSTSDRMIVFGGKVAGAPENDLWILQNASGTIPTWSQSFAPTLPPKRLGHTAVYNDQGNQMVIFGGALDSNGNQLTNDLWGLTNADVPSGSHWTSRSAGSAPTHRWGHSAVYDLAADTMVVFGGIEQTGQTLLSEVWVLHQTSTSPIWQQVTPSGGPPSARCCMAAGYDAANRRMIIFGGFGGAALFGDLWTLTFDPTFSTATWQQLTPSVGTAPAARCCGVGLWDGSQFLVFGGGQFGNPASDDRVHALVLGATTFSSADGPGGGPAARTFPTAVPVGRLLLFGGSSASAALNDLWQLK